MRILALAVAVLLAAVVLIPPPAAAGVSQTTVRWAYNGNGATVAFSVPHYFTNSNQVVVYTRDTTTKYETLQEIGTHYTVSGVGQAAGGTVTFLAAPATGTQVVIFLAPPITQDLDLADGEAYSLEDLEKRLDLITIMVQRLNDQMGRAVRLTDAQTDTFDPTLPVTLTANKAIRMNATGTGLIFVDSTFSANSVTTLEVLDGTLTNADVSASAGILLTKLETIATDRILGRATAGTGAIELLTCTAAGRNILDDASAAAQRVTLGVEIGVNVQAFDAELQALAGLASAAGKGIKFTGPGTAGTFDISSFGEQIIDDANAGAVRTTIGVEIGVNVQAYDSELQALAGLVSAANKIPIFTGGGTAGFLSIGSGLTLVAGELSASMGGVPPGVVVPYSGNVTPSGWLMCDGAAYSRTGKAALFAATCKTGTGNTFDEGTDVVTATAHGLYTNDPIQFYAATNLPTGLSEGTKYYVRDVTTNTFKVATSPSGSAIDLTGNEAGAQSWINAPYGDGDGEAATTFNVPDGRGRVFAGPDAVQGGTAASRLTSGGSGIKALALGEAGGTETHILTVAQLPAHTHPETTDGIRAVGLGNVAAGGGLAHNFSPAANTGSTGGDQAHQNTQPTITANWIIKE